VQTGLDPTRPRWRPKTPSELEADRRRNRFRRTNPLQPAIIGCIFFVLFSVIMLSTLLFEHDTSRTDLLVISVLVTACAVFAFFAAYAFQICGALSLARTPRLQLCPTCFAVGLPSVNRVCQCGSRRVDLADWTLAYCPACGYDLRGTPGYCPECGRGLHSNFIPPKNSDVSN
jgi:hypothetical protein